ncbi:MAG TPA: glycoside hydrolase family protein [Nitrolancea sp.]
MIAIEKLTARLISDEGEVLHAYEDHLGYLTIGVGRLIDKRKGGGITREESRYLLKNDIEKRIAECESRFEWFDSLDDVRQGVIVCMAFQLGTDGVAQFKKMIAALKVRDYERAADEMLDSAWAKQTPARAQLMAQIMRTGVWQ